jgi:hypothetical protein
VACTVLGARAPMRTTSLILASLITLLASPARADEGDAHEGDAHEGDESVVRPSSRGMFAGFGIGPSIGILGCNDTGCDTDASFNQLKIAEEIGFHFSGDGEGPALGVSFEEGFGDHLIRFQPGVKFWWDIQPDNDLALYIAPTVKAGYALFHLDLEGLGEANEHAFNGQVGAAVRLVLADRALVYLRPITLDMFFTEDGMAMTYDIMAGGEVTF